VGRARLEDGRRTLTSPHAHVLDPDCPTKRTTSSDVCTRTRQGPRLCWAKHKQLGSARSRQEDMENDPRQPWYQWAENHSQCLRCRSNCRFSEKSSTQYVNDSSSRCRCSTNSRAGTGSGRNTSGGSSSSSSAYFNCSVSRGQKKGKGGGGEGEGGGGSENAYSANGYTNAQLALRPSHGGSKLRHPQHEGNHKHS